MYASMYFYIFLIKSTPCSPPSAAVWTWWCSPCCRTEPAAHRSPCSCCVGPPSAWRRSPSPPSPQPQRRTVHCWRSDPRGKEGVSNRVFVSLFFHYLTYWSLCGFVARKILTSMSMFMHGSRSPLFRVGLRTDSNRWTVKVSTWTWMEGSTERQTETNIRMLKDNHLKKESPKKKSKRVFVSACSYLVALDEDRLHLFEQVLQVPVA